MRWAAACLVVLSLATASQTLASPRSFELRLEYSTEEKSGESSSGSSSGHSALVERIIADRQDGTELLYDLPDGTPKLDREREWMFPARVFRARSDGSYTLLNVAELEARRDNWLKLAKLPKKACGEWYFTWNAFKVECDPQAVIGAIQGYAALSGELREGESYRVPGAGAAGTLKFTEDVEGRRKLAVELPVDPDWVRRKRAESAVVVGQIMRKPVLLADALKAQGVSQISGTMVISFEFLQGNVTRRIQVTKLETKANDGQVTTSVATETLTRTPIAEAILNHRP